MFEAVWVYLFMQWLSLLILIRFKLGLRHRDQMPLMKYFLILLRLAAETAVFVQPCVCEPLYHDFRNISQIFMIFVMNSVKLDVSSSFKPFITRYQEVQRSGTENFRSGSFTIFMQCNVLKCSVYFFYENFLMLWHSSFQNVKQQKSNHCK
jgi:hypothetical protein